MPLKGLKLNVFKPVTMIDGVQVTYYEQDEVLAALLDWDVLVNERTGKRIDNMRTATIRAINLKLKDCSGGGQILLLNGSLHKYCNFGEENSNDFPFYALYDTIYNLTDALQIRPKNCMLHGLEVGINIILPFPPLRIINNVVTFKGKPFTQINKRNAHKGIVCSLSEYDLKIYDKAAQSGIDCGYVLRFEVHLHKMRVIKDYGIKTLHDLQNPYKTYHLKQLLLDMLGGIIWTDSTVNLSNLTDREQKQWLSLNNPKNWQDMNKFKALRQRKKAVELMTKYGKVEDLEPYINTTWERLFDGVFEAENPLPFHRLDTKMEAIENATFSLLECSGERLHDLPQNSNNTDTGLLPPILTNNLIELTNKISVKMKQNKPKKADLQPVKRHCKSCARNINQQRPKSLFCSEAKYGKAAKRCRNKDSNRRLHFKRKILKAMNKNNFIAITYHDENGETFTDTLHPSEMGITKEWLERIIKIDILPVTPNEPLETLQGLKAHDYIKSVKQIICVQKLN